MVEKIEKITKRNIHEFRYKLIKWFEDNKRVYPWREEGLTAYQYIIAEILLQRTKADTVAKFFKTFIKNYPDWETINNATPTQIEQSLAILGLQKQRTKRLKLLAETMIQLKGVFPESREELDKVPFIGQYIANTIEVLVFNKRAPFLDVNMARVLERYFGKRKLADIRYDPYLQNLAYKVVDHPKTKEINWAILDFAALICIARKPKCEICIFAKKCKFNLNIK